MDTHVTLRDHIDAQIDAHKDVHRLEAQALAVATIEINRRLEGMNELRAQIDKERGTFVTVIAYDIQKDLTNTLLNGMNGRLQSLESRFYAIILLSGLIGGVVGHFSAKLIP